MLSIRAILPGPISGRGLARAASGFAVALSLLLAGCGEPPYDATGLRQAAELGVKENKWPEARPLIREHLLRHPNDPVAHYYYGLSFLHLGEPQLTIAEGELLTAQALIERDHPVHQEALERDLQHFLGELHQKTALVYMRAYYESFRFNVPVDVQRELLKKSIAQTEQGLKANPNSKHLEEYLEALQEQLKGTPQRMPDVVTQSAENGAEI